MASRSARVIRDREDCRGIADIDPDDGLFGHRLSDGFEQAARQTAAPGGISLFPSAFSKQTAMTAARSAEGTSSRTRQRGRRVMLAFCCTPRRTTSSISGRDIE
jgi:hypothetical protein